MNANDAAGSTPRMHLPDARAIVARRGRSVLLIAAPYASRVGTTYKDVEDLALSMSADRAPKVLVEPPSGDFSVVTSVAITRSATAPWAAGDLRNKTAWGHVNQVPVAGLTLSSEEAAVKLRVGRVSKLKYAFIVVASKAGDITPELDLVERLDVLRRYFELALPKASRGLLQADTTI